MPDIQTMADALKGDSLFIGEIRLSWAGKWLRVYVCPGRNQPIVELAVVAIAQNGQETELRRFAFPAFVTSDLIKLLDTAKKAAGGAVKSR